MGWGSICYWIIGRKEKKSLGTRKQWAEVLACSVHPIMESVTFPNSKHMLTLTAKSTTLLARVLSYSPTLLMVAINIQSGLEVKFHGQMWVYHVTLGSSQSTNK